MSKSLMRRQRLERPREDKPPSFRFFLKQQRDRQDQTGDLSRHILNARGNLPPNTLEGYRDMLQRAGCSAAMFHALSLAWIEYE